MVDWNTFIGTIRKSELLGKASKVQIIIRLFKKAGAENAVSVDAAKKWISNTRTCKANTYFKEGKLKNVSDALDFFRNRPDEKISKLQQLFREVDGDSIIDLKTDDMGIFCKSLVNQFEDLLGFERSDMSNIKMPSPNNESVINENVNTDSSKNLECIKEMIKPFKEIAEYCKIKDFINRDPSLICLRSPVLNYDLLPLADRFVKDVKSNILSLFEPYQKELTYIQISQFVMLVSEYKEYLRHNWHNSEVQLKNNFKSQLFDEVFLNHKSEFETRTERYCEQLNYLYNDLLMK